MSASAQLFDLWSTPVLVVKNSVPPDLQKFFIDSVDSASYKDIKHLHLERQARAEINDLMGVIEHHAARLGSDYFGKECTASVEEFWLNDHASDDSESTHKMHAHARYHMACTYYPLAGGGELHLFNPNGGSIWSVASEKGISNNFSIVPESGMMIFFPGSTVHSTTPNLSGVRRMCMPSNIMLNF